MRPDLIGGTKVEAWDCLRDCCKTERRRPWGSHGPLWTPELQLHSSTLPHSCHAASSSVAVWAQTLAQTGCRRPLTISLFREADRRRQSTRTWPAIPWEDSQPASTGTGRISLSTLRGSWNQRAGALDGVVEDTSNELMDSQEAGSAKATGQT